MTRVKICGVCRAEDAAAAVAAGVDAIGMVLAPGLARSVSIEEALSIAALLPPFVSLVGLFVDMSAEEILHVARQVPLSLIQLHGEETPETVAALKPLRVIKALRIGRGGEAGLSVWREAISRLGLSNLGGFLLDTLHAGGAPGGAGVANNWEALCEMKGRGVFEGLPPIIAAGGLRSKSVGEVIRKFRPYSVDVSSGVEEAKRRKSRKEMEAFVGAVREADRIEVTPL